MTDTNDMNYIDNTYYANDIDYNNGIDSMNHMCYTYNAYKRKALYSSNEGI